MTIYYSNFSNVDLKHQTMETPDYSNYYDNLKVARTYETEHEDYTKSSNRDK